MVRVYLANAFSLSMLPAPYSKVAIKKIDLDEARRIVKEYEWESAVGHASTAAILSRILGVDVPAERKMIKIDFDRPVLVIQLLFRLPEGKVLSEEELAEAVKSGKVAFYLVRLEEVGSGGR